MDICPTFHVLLFRWSLFSQVSGNAITFSHLELPKFITTSKPVSLYAHPDVPDIDYNYALTHTNQEIKIVTFLRRNEKQMKGVKQAHCGSSL